MNYGAAPQFEITKVDKLFQSEKRRNESFSSVFF
jgi:hypothetical protein